MSAARPILVFDSGVGGLTVLAEIRKLLPDVSTVFAADTAVFPYGALSDEALLARVEKVMAALIARYSPSLVVIACNTASTLVLPMLRARYALPFVGTVPAIKPAAAMTRSGLISVLATPATVRRDYTAGLIRQFASACEVKLVGSDKLASLAEAYLRGESVSDAAIAEEIAPGFVARGDKGTDVVVLACTHYPLLLPAFERLAPWPVMWINSAPAIARRVRDVLPSREARPSARHCAIVTSNGAASVALAPALKRYGIADIAVAPIA